MSTIFDNLSYTLDIGYYGSRFGICCPDCEFEENKSLHFLGNVVKFFQTYEAAPCAFSGCCFNMYTTVLTYLDDFVENIGNEFLDSLKDEYFYDGLNDYILSVTSGETACLDNNFYSCITQISGLCDDFSVFVNSGIIEVNTLSGQSAICILKDYIINNSLSTSDAQNLLSLFFNTGYSAQGMITFCDDNIIFIGGVEPFLSYGEATGFIANCSEPPPPVPS